MPRRPAGIGNAAFFCGDLSTLLAKNRDVRARPRAPPRTMPPDPALSP